MSPSDKPADDATLGGSLDDAAKGRAYAQAAWQRFDSEVDEPLQKAVTGAFVLVAASDGSLAAEEAERFLESHAGAFAPVSLASTFQPLRQPIRISAAR